MRHRNPVTASIAFALVAGLSTSAAAYVGPGAGLGLLGALWGVLAAVVATLAFVILWPLRKRRKNRLNRATAGQGGETADEQKNAS